MLQLCKLADLGKHVIFCSIPCQQGVMYEALQGVTHTRV